MRASPRDIAHRVFNTVARATIKKVNDRPKMQEVDVDINFLESKVAVERFQQYGISSVPKDEQGEDAAEAIILFVDGDRSHGIVIAVDDRRYRVKNLKAGEVALYDDQNQVVKLTRDQIEVTTDKKVVVNATKSVMVKSGKVEVFLDGDEKKLYLGKKDGAKPVITAIGESDSVFSVKTIT